MNYLEAKELIDNGIEWVQGRGEIVITPTDGMPESKHWPKQHPSLAATINGADYIAFEVLPVPRTLGHDDDVRVSTEDGAELGVLCLTSRVWGVAPSSLTQFRRLALVTDGPRTCDPSQHRFACDYFVIRRDRSAEYFCKYSATSGLWGGFIHSAPSAPAAPSTISDITARSGLRLPRAEHTEALRRACVTDWTFYRYLKLYHLLELQFDLHLRDQILATGDDLHGFSQIINSYNMNELDRIVMILCDRIRDLPALANVLEGLDWNNSTLADVIYFHETSKGNPFRGADGLDELREWTTRRLFSWPNFSAAGRPGVRREEEHRQKVIRFAAFVIYRFRCCIAHFRIGEYILRESDERVVLSFAEPVLKEALRQVFRQ